MLRYHAAYYLPNGENKMVVAEILDFPGVFSQGFDLPDARRMIADALADIAQIHLEEGRALPVPNPEAAAPDADFIELLPLSVEVGATKRWSAENCWRIFANAGASLIAKADDIQFC